MHRVSKLKLAEVNPYLICKLCSGYFIDPCTAQDCLHTFCKTCIVKHLYQHCTCPICGVVIHKTRPLEMIRHDQTMQDLVYKLVPGVFGKEMQRRRAFYSSHPEPDPNTCGNSEERGEVKEDREILAEDDSISVALVHSPNGDAKPAPSDNGDTGGLPAIYLRCPANFSVSGIKKLIRAKYDLAQQFLIDIFHSDESLSEDYTLMDIAFIYTYRRRGPLRIFYTIYQFDPTVNINEQEIISTENKTEIKPATDKGSTFEITDSVTITEILKEPQAQNTGDDKSVTKMEETADSKADATADSKKSKTDLTVESMEEGKVVSEGISGQTVSKTSSQKTETEGSSNTEGTQASTDSSHANKDLKSSAEPMEVTEGSAVPSSTL